LTGASIARFTSRHLFRRHGGPAPGRCFAAGDTDPSEGKAVSSPRLKVLGAELTALAVVSIRIPVSSRPGARRCSPSLPPRRIAKLARSVRSVSRPRLAVAEAASPRIGHDQAL